MIKEKLMVSAIILTYKHEKYIKKAIESILIQDTDFEYELIIADDCSPDNTKKIVTDIIEKHPKAYRIKYFSQKKNIGMLANGNFSLNKAEGKYIAFCEGDDYWIDSLKLKKQVNFLEENPGFSCCAHNSIIKYENATNSNLQQFNPINNKNDTLFKKDFLNISKFHTSSILLRKIFIENIINKDPLLVRDNPLKINLLQFGPIKILPDVMSIYYRNLKGFSENINIERIYKTEIDTATALGQNLQGFYFKALFIKSHWHRYYLINGKNLSLLKKLKLFFKFLIPSFYRFPRNIRDILSSIYNGFLK